MHLPLRRALAALVVAVTLSTVVVTSAVAHDDVVGTPAVTITARASLDRDDVTIRSGEIVRFVNGDDERHRFRSRTGPDDFDTNDLEPGESTLVRFVTTGTYAFRDERDRDAAGYQGRIRVIATTSAATPSTGGGSTSAGAPTTATVSIGDRVFQPGTTTIAAGGTVTFKNQDDREHTATSDGDGPIDSGTLGTGGTYRVKLPAAGSYAFLCLIHPEMRGTIKVLDAAGGTGSTPSSTPAPTPTPAPPSPAPSVEPTASPVSGPVAIDIVDYAFDSASVQVPVGARVTWTNRGKAPHTVTASDGSFDSGTLPAGATFETTFAAAGDFAYACAIHPDMIATVTVVSAEGSAGGGPTGDTPVSSDGSVARAATGAAGVPPPTAGPGSDGQDAPLTADRASIDLAGVGGIVVTIGLVLAAGVLFSRAVRGSVRPT